MKRSWSIASIAVLVVVVIMIGATAGSTITGSFIRRGERRQILNMLNQKCHVTSFTNIGGINIGKDCNWLCGNNNEICISGSFEEVGVINGIRNTFYTGDLINCDYDMYESSFGAKTTYSCMCCLP